MSLFPKYSSGDECPSCGHGELVDCSTNFVYRLECVFCDFSYEKG